MPSVGNIVKVIGFIILMGLFFGYTVSNGIFEKMKLYITSFNTNFFANLPVEVIWLFTFLVFILILAYILSFFKD